MMRKILALMMALCLMLGCAQVLAEGVTSFETSYHVFNVPSDGLLVMQQDVHDDGAEVIFFMHSGCMVSLWSINLNAYLDYGTVQEENLMGVHTAYLASEGAHHTWTEEPELLKWPTSTGSTRQLVYSCLPPTEQQYEQYLVVVTEFDKYSAYSICVSFTPGNERVSELLAALIDGASTRADANANAQKNAENLVPKIYVVITEATAMIRTEPSVMGPLLFTAARGDSYVYAGEVDNFYILDIDGTTAYVSKGVSRIK